MLQVAELYDVRFTISEGERVWLVVPPRTRRSAFFRPIGRNLGHDREHAMKALPQHPTLISLAKVGVPVDLLRVCLCLAGLLRWR